MLYDLWSRLRGVDRRVSYLCGEYIIYFSSKFVLKTFAMFELNLYIGCSEQNTLLLVIRYNLKETSVFVKVHILRAKDS